MIIVVILKVIATRKVSRRNWIKERDKNLPLRAQCQLRLLCC